MKKQHFYILLFTLLPSSIFAQANTLPYQEVGFNLGFLVENLLRNEISPARIGERNFMLTYKKHSLLNTYFRYGLSFQFNKNKSDNDDPLKSFRTDFRLGYETKFQLDKRWTINRGVDVVVNHFSTDNSFSDDKTKINQIGLVPFVGIQFNINPRVNLSTEAGVGIFYVNKQQNAFIFNLFSTSRATGNGVLINIFAPRELILSVSF